MDNNEIIFSNSYDVTYGTAQDSCLRPLLFIPFTNDLYLLPTFSSIILFADDTIVLNSHKNLQFLKFTLEHDMPILTDWYKANQLSLNVNKTVLMKFWLSYKPFSIKLGDTELINTNCTKFLGVTVDDCLK